ncbi:MAG: M20/M25/M40 family metallo-hydrolase [Pirellulaceae bacterium]
MRTTLEYPSSPGQMALGKLLADELRAMGASAVEHDAHGLVWGTIPASVPHGIGSDVPTVLFNAHLDTSPEAAGSNVRPQVIESYSGGDIPLLQDGQVITVAGSPDLQGLIGHCLITSDGSTLLGGDDKAGVAAIMELAQHLLENPHLPHGEVRVLFTCDEEIGQRTAREPRQSGSVSGIYARWGRPGGGRSGEFFRRSTVGARHRQQHPPFARQRTHDQCRARASTVIG